MHIIVSFIVIIPSYILIRLFKYCILREFESAITQDGVREMEKMSEGRKSGCSLCTHDA